MDSRPTPKPRKFQNTYENVKRPVPLPRIKEAVGGPSTSKESIEECVVLRDKSRSKTSSQNAEEGKSIVKQIQDNLFNNNSPSKEPRNKFTKSVMEGKKSINNQFLNLTKKRKNKNVLNVPQQDRCVSMPVTDTKLFDSIQFNSPINEQLQYDNVKQTSRHSLSSESNTNSPNISLSSDVDLNSTLSLLRDDDSSASGSISFNADSASKLSNVANDSETYEHLSASSNSWLLYDAVPSNDPIQTVNEPQRDDVVQIRDHNIKTPRPSQSIMIEFDPLSRNNSRIATGSHNLALLETLSNNNVDDSRSVCTDNDTEYDFYWDDSVAYLSPPTPPERLDSLFLNKQKTEERNKSENKEKLQEVQQSKWFVNENYEDEKTTDEEMNKHSSIAFRFSNMLKIVPESASYLKKMIDQGGGSNIPSKLLLSKNASRYQGKMVRFLPGGIEEMLKKYSMRPCSLADHKLIFYQENSNVKDVYNMKSFFSVQIILAHKFNYDGELHCFQINFSSLGTFNLNRGSVIFGCENETERNYWIRKIVESFSENFPVAYVTQLTRFGWCYLKEGVSGVWDAAWILLSKRKLFYYTTQDSNVRSVDLRKARCVVLREANEKKVSESGYYILLDQQDLSLYLKMGASRETKIWHRIIKAVATNNGSSIHHQQLTKDDIPTIVDKCINFIYTQGSLSVGIYRKAGSNGLVTQLLTDFRADAWAVQLASRTHSEHDVATALKRFFRDLPDSLLTTEYHPMFCAITDIRNKEEKVKKYKSLISNLSTISQNTLRKLIGHLHFIQSLSDENCMTSLNLATVWGPTLLSPPKCGDAGMLQEETKVIYDLIDLYMLIYEPSKSDIEREQKMLSVLKQCQKVTNPIQKRSGDLHVWIYLFERAAGNPVNIVLKPGRTSGDVCLELCSKVGKEYHVLMIEEVICGDSMRRPLHHNESLLDVVLRWGYWDEKDRCDNYLVLRNNDILIDAANAVDLNKPISLNMELRFANEKMKSFCGCIAEYNEGKLTCSKDKTSNNQNLLGTWKVNELRWYLGYEVKRNPQSKWSITFIEKNKTLRTKEKPWFGNTIAGSLKEEQFSWIGALLHSEYSLEGLVPEPRLIIT